MGIYRSARALLLRWLVRRFDLPDMAGTLHRLHVQGLRPRVIYDVGALRGDFAKAAHAVWPASSVFCFEPLPHWQEELARVTAGMPGARVFETLLGAAERDSVAFHSCESGSSVLVENTPPQQTVIARPQTTVDAITQRTGLPPDFLKIDVQGYELEVLKGATASLPGVATILAEANLLDLHRDVPLLADLVRWLDERDFVAFDICGFARRPRDRALWQADFVFVPRQSPLRASKSYY